ncbi:MAG: ornithine aminotransferase [Bogoriella megaspora]|nr:MAG: ornithine aminotransferase [Bogoriella megaspora]
MSPIALNDESHTSRNVNMTKRQHAADGQASHSRFHATSSQEATSLEASHAAHNYHPLPIVFSRASGCQVWDPEGKEYLDFLSAYSAVNQGHCHPELVKTMIEQASRLTLSSRAFYNDVFPKFAEFVTRYFGFDMVLPMNTGAEAVETAVKIARKWGYKVKGIPENEAMDGKPMKPRYQLSMLIWTLKFAAITMSTDPESRDNYGPYLPNLGSICPKTKQVIHYNNVEDIKNVLEAHGSKTAAIIVEPIQGEAGIVVPDDDYLQKVKTLCEEHNVLLICDEIQTGIARTGKLLCHEWSGIKPDLVLLGKAISGGMYPVSCVLGSKDIMLTIEPGTHGSTYGGNPLGSAIAIRALELVQEENMVANAERLGQIFRQGILNLQNPMIKLVRGKGLLNAMVIDETRTNGHSAWDLCMLMKEKGLLVGRALKIAHVQERLADENDGAQAKPTHQNIIRLAPPLVITEAQIQTALNIIKEAVEELPSLKGRKEKEIIPDGEKNIHIGVDN